MNNRGPIIQLPPPIKFLSVESIVLTLKRNRIGVKRLGRASSINVFNGFRKKAPNIRLSLPWLDSISYEEGDFSGQYCLPLQG